MRFDSPAARSIADIIAVQLLVVCQKATFSLVCYSLVADSLVAFTWCVNMLALEFELCSFTLDLTPGYLDAGFRGDPLLV